MSTPLSEVEPLGLFVDAHESYCTCRDDVHVGFSAMALDFLTRNLEVRTARPPN